MKSFCITLLVITMAVIGYAQGNSTVIPLYPDGIPNSKPIPAGYVETEVRKGWVTNVSVPALIPFFPEKGKATGTAIIICPGGGYFQLSMDNEGINIAKAFAQAGVTAFVLKYRLPSDLIMVDKTIGPLQDAQQALIIVRTRAADWDIDPAKVGMAGFSAGGHLATTTAAWYNKPVVANPANINLKPDFMVLLYPATTFSNAEHHDSKDHLIGLSPTAEQIELFSSEKHITTNTSPTFLVQAEDDPLVTIQSTLNFYGELAKAHVKAEMHIYPEGGHGFGLINKKSKEHWFDWCISWMNSNGF